MNYLWSGMLLLGIVYGAFSGNMQEVTDAALNSAKGAVTLCITMTGVMGLWVGLMEIAKDAGLVEGMARGIRPVIDFLFPRIPEGHKAKEYIATNMISNFLGLGMASTPAGLKAMEELEKLEEERRENQRAVGVEGGTVGKGPLGRGAAGSKGRAVPKGTASNEMCTFLIVNISSLQLIPVNIIAYRSQYGSANPAGIVGAAILATAVSTGVGVVFCKVMDWRKI